MQKKVGYFLTGAGALVALLSLSLDLFGIGQPGIQAAQLLGAQVGILAALIGIGLIFHARSNSESIFEGIKKIFQQIPDWPLITWVLAGFLLVYVLFFIFPAFFNATSRIYYFDHYLPDKYPIGNDFLYSTGALKEWLAGRNPYSLTAHYYPPLYHIIFAPFLLLGYPNNFYLITSITLASLFLTGFILPICMKKEANLTVLLFFLLTALFSYGLQFELERGQFNMITFTLCILAIYLFYYQPAFRYLAYVLFSISVNLKLYPLIFIVMFIKDWRDWKNNIKRLAGLGLFNLALLFVIGPDIFMKFLNALPKNNGSEVVTFPGNHSITVFVYNLAHDEYGQLSGTLLSWLKNNSTPVSLIFFGIFGVCFLLVLYRAYRENNNGINADLLLMCTLGALMIPSSIDYKLELLAAPMALALYNREMPVKLWQKIVFALTVFSASFAYSLTLVPYKYRLDSGIFANSFPMLFMILIALTILNLISKNKKLSPASA